MSYFFNNFAFIWREFLKFERIFNTDMNFQNFQYAIW